MSGMIAFEGQLNGIVKEVSFIYNNNRFKIQQTI